jgi:hypothetical protein
MCTIADKVMDHHCRLLLTVDERAEWTWSPVMMTAPQRKDREKCAGSLSR